MSEIDDTIRREVRQQLDRLQVPTAGRVAAIRSDLRRSRRRRGLAGAGVALVVCSIAVIYMLSGRQSQQVPEPATHLRVVRSLSLSSLGLAKPEAVALGPNGNLYVIDSVHQTVTEATASGRVIRTWGGEGPRPGQFRLADGSRIAVDQKGRVYVADSGNGRVQVFSSSGRFIRQIGTFGGLAGQFVYPTAIAVSPDGSVYVSDDSRTTLTKMSPTGHQEWRLGGPRTLPSTPPDLAGHLHFGSIDSHGRLVVANDDTSRIVYISPGGHEVDAFGHGTTRDEPSDFPKGSCDTTVDSKGYVYVAGCIPSRKTGNLIQIYDANHRLVGVWRHSPAVTAPRFGSGDLAVSVGYNSILELAVDH
jgi:DNA-binding beta-propeller fold protein YncE